MQTGRVVRSGRDPRELGGAWARHQRHTATDPPADLAPLVERLWAVEWEYDAPYRQKIVPYPNVHVTVRRDGWPQVSGPASAHVVRELAGRGAVAGAVFRPGVFRAVLHAPVASLTDRVVPAVEVPGLPPGRPGAPSVSALAEWLRAMPAREPDAAGREAAAAVALVAADRTLTRVDHLAARCGTGVRRLQRLFAEHVGVGPKWVIRRYRLHEVTERLAVGDPVDWAGLAAELGHADQAHLSRVFTVLFGEPPTHYAQRYPARR